MALVVLVVSIVRQVDQSKLDCSLTKKAKIPATVIFELFSQEKRRLKIKTELLGTMLSELNDEKLDSEFVARGVAIFPLQSVATLQHCEVTNSLTQKRQTEFDQLISDMQAQYTQTGPTSDKVQKYNHK